MGPHGDKKTTKGPCASHRHSLFFGFLVKDDPRVCTTKNVVRGVKPQLSAWSHLNRYCKTKSAMSRQFKRIAIRPSSNWVSKQCKQVGLVATPCSSVTGLRHCVDHARARFQGFTNDEVRWSLSTPPTFHHFWVLRTIEALTGTFVMLHRGLGRPRGDNGLCKGFVCEPPNPRLASYASAVRESIGH